MKTDFTYWIEHIFETYVYPLIERAVHKALKQYGLHPKKQENEDELLNAKKSAEFLGVAVQTLYGYTSEGKINTYGSGKPIFCKRSELLALKSQLRTKSKDQINKEVEAELKKLKKS